MDMNRGHIMNSFSIWCTTSTEEYPLIEHTLTRTAASPHVQQAIIVATGNTKPANFGRYETSNPKFREFHKNFGEGFDRAIDDGGYDQVAARNFALDRVEETDAGWAVQIDADEIYEPIIFRMLQDVPDDISAVTGSYYTLLSESTYWFEPRKQRMFKSGLVYDPHTSFWRMSLGLRYERSPNVEEKFVNFSRHCGVRFNRIPDVKIAAVTQPYYFHLHCLLGKRHTSRMSQNERPLEFDLPEQTAQAIVSIQRAGHPFITKATDRVRKRSNHT
jgi:hypothetical protein